MTVGESLRTATSPRFHPRKTFLVFSFNIFSTFFQQVSFVLAMALFRLARASTTARLTSPLRSFHQAQPGLSLAQPPRLVLRPPPNQTHLTKPHRNTFIPNSFFSYRCRLLLLLPLLLLSISNQLPIHYPFNFQLLPIEQHPLLSKRNSLSSTGLILSFPSH